MKKIFLAISIIAFCSYSCQDVNDGFDWLDDASKPTNKASYTYTVTDNDISTITKAAGGTADSLYSKQLQKDKMFSDAAPANILMPYLLAARYYTCDPGSSADVTYKYIVDRSEAVSGLTGNQYALTNADYKSVWGDKYTNSFTPKKSPEKNIPNILKTNYPNAADKAIQNISYYYSEEEPVDVTVIGEIFSNETFENMGLPVNSPVAVAGWINKDLKGTRSWQVKEFSSNTYGQATSYNSKEVNDVWLITPKRTIANKPNIQFSFDVAVGNFKAECFKVYISENFDGNENNILSATWKDITSAFVIPQLATGYSVMGKAGDYNLDSYKGKSVYFAFRYEGDGTDGSVKTTTYQVDNVKVYEATPGIEVKSKELMYAAYQLNAGVWAPYNNKNTIILQPSDYEKMGVQYIKTANANNYLPEYLRKHFDYTQEGTSKVIVYLSEQGKCYADEYVYTKGSWVVNSFIIEKTEQFVFTTDHKWIFDPTIVITPVADDYWLVVNYVKAKDPSLIIGSGSNTEAYYGFNAGYRNITFRESDRLADKTYPTNGTAEEKLAFCKQRAIEGLEVLLSEKYPAAQPTVGGIEQFAKLTVVIYYGPKSGNVENFVYEFQCVGTKEWKFLQRTSLLDGTVEKGK